MKKKLLTLLALIVGAIGSAWGDTETLFSTKCTASSDVSIDAGTTDITENSNVTISGGSMFVYNGQSSAKNLMTSKGFAMTNNNTYFKVVLNKALQAGDKIQATFTGGTRSKDNVTYELGIVVSSTEYSNGNAGDHDCKATASSTTTDGSNLEYTVTSSDEYFGKTTLYIYRVYGATQYFNNFKVTQEVASKASTPTVILGDYDTTTDKYSVTLNCTTENATIYYSTDNKANYSVYSTALSLAPGTTLDAYATAEGLDNSNDMEQYTVPATPTAWTLTFANAEGATGIVPAEVNVNLGDSYTLPANFTMYKEGYTLTGWNDGTDTYNVGALYTPTGNKTLTAVYTENTVSLADRTGAVTIKWEPFNQSLGIPDIHFEGNTGFVVAQATVAGSSIDVKLPIDATSGKFKNQASNNWTQVGPNTIFTIPAADGATVTYKQYDDGTTTTPEVNVVAANLDDNGNYGLTADGTAGKLYYEYIQVTLPALPVENVADFKFTAKSDWNNSNYQTVGKITATFTNNAQNTYVKFAKENTLTLAVTGNYVITKVELGYDSNYSPTEGTITADKGTMNDAGTLWTGCANGLVFTKTANSNDARVNMLKVTYAPAVSTTLSSYEWTTFVSDKDLDFTNSDVKAYVVTGYTGQSINKNNDVKKVPANTPLLLNAPEGTYYIPITDTPESITTNCLKAGNGDAVAKEDGKTRYVLSLDDHNNIAFLKINNDPATVPANKAYLEFDGEVNAPTFGFGDATAIDEVRSKTEDVRGDFYNLNGQRVAQPTKGLYIVNGKKVIVK